MTYCEWISLSLPKSVSGQLMETIRITIHVRWGTAEHRLLLLLMLCIMSKRYIAKVCCPAVRQNALSWSGGLEWISHSLLGNFKGIRTVR